MATPRSRQSRLLVALILVAALLLGVAPGAAADGDAPPPNEPPPAYHLPPGLAPPGYQPSQEACPMGDAECVDDIVEEMTAHFAALGCDHNAVFALLYLITTEFIRDAIRGEGVFVDGEDVFANASLLNRQATVFARYYLDAFNAWEAGKSSRVPEAWRIAFDAAEGREVHTFGNMFLGISAHVNRDLPFVLYRMGVYPEHHDDHNAVNDVLGAARGASFPAIGGLLDPTIFRMPDEDPVPFPDFLSAADLVADWREGAWQWAAKLAEAPDAKARAEVAAEIEAHAAEIAEDIAAWFAYEELAGLDGIDPDSRDGFCTTWGVGAGR